MTRAPLLAALVAVALTGCGGDEKPAAPSPDPGDPKMFEKSVPPKAPAAQAPPPQKPG